VSSISIAFGSGVPDQIRRRITYAAQSYAAVYGLEWKTSGAQVRLCYGLDASERGDVAIPALYRPAASGTRAVEWHPLPEAFLDGEAEAFPRAHPGAKEVDWLGEIFEWLGGELELVDTETDAYGRTTFASTVPGRLGADAEVPWAAVAMRALNLRIRETVGEWPDRPRPLGDGRAVIVTSHDLDYLPVSRLENIVRLAKNVAVAQVVLRHPRLAISIAAKLRSFGVRGPGSEFDAVIAEERRLGAESSSYVIVSREHRRDANYDLDDPAVLASLRRLEGQGMELGIHGSYDSVLGGGSLANEYEKLRRHGFAVTGGRQHWLRYRAPELFDGLVRAGATYDTSVGYYDRSGFRAGACFAYAPYDFAKEAAYPLFQFPMAVMDGPLAARFRDDGAGALAACETLLRRTAKYGPGGVSILWHNTAFGETQLPGAIGEVYPALLASGHRFVAGRTAVRELSARFVAAGLRSTVPSGPISRE
jgi:hypothetical protein